MKIYWHDAGHMIKMAATPIYGKKPSKIFFSGTGVDRFPQNLISSIDDSCSS